MVLTSCRHIPLLTASRHTSTPLVWMVVATEMLLTALVLSTCVSSASAVTTEQVMELCSFEGADNLCSFHSTGGWNKMSPAADHGPHTDHTGVTMSIIPANNSSDQFPMYKEAHAMLLSGILSAGPKFVALWSCCLPDCWSFASHTMFPLYGCTLLAHRLFTGVVCLRFFYFISGYNSVHLEISMKSTSTQRTVWREARSEVTQWTLAQTTLTSNTSFNIVFNGTKTRTSGFLAIDDVTVTSGSCALSVVSQEPVMASTDEWSSGTTNRDFAYLASVPPESSTRPMLTPTSPIPGHAKPPVSAATMSRTALADDWWTPSTGDRGSYFTANHSGTGRLTTLPNLHNITAEVLSRTAKMVADMTTMREFSPTVTSSGSQPTINSSGSDVTSEAAAAVAMSTDSHVARNPQEVCEKTAWQIATIVLGLLLLLTLVAVFWLHWCKRQRVNLYKQRKALRGRVVVTYKGSEHRNTEMTERQDSFFSVASPRSNYSSVIPALDDSGSRSTCFHHEDELDTDRHEEEDTCHSQDEAEPGNDDDDVDDEMTSHVDPSYLSTTHLTSQGAQTWCYREGRPNCLSVSSLTDWSQLAPSPGTWPSLVPGGTTHDQDSVSASQQPARSEWLLGTTATSATTSASVKGEKRGRFQRGVAVTRGTRYPAQNSVLDPPSPVDNLPAVGGKVSREAKGQQQEVIYGNVQTFAPSDGSSVNGLDIRRLRPASQQAGQTVEPPKWSSELSFADNLTGMPRELSAAIERRLPQPVSGVARDTVLQLLAYPGSKMQEVSATPVELAGAATFHTSLGSRKGHVTGTSVNEDKGGKGSSQTRVVGLSRHKLENTNERSAECVRTQEGGLSMKKEPAHSFILRI